MSSFRVERQRISFQAQGEQSQRTQSDKPDVLSEIQREQETLMQQRQETERKIARVEQMLEQAQRERSTILERAQQEATQIIANGQKQAKDAYDAAQKSGYADGQKVSEQANEAWRATEREKLDAKLQQTRQDYEDRLRELQKNLTELVMEITKKVIGIQLATSDEALLNIVAAALSRFRQNEEVVVHLSREDYQHFSEEGSIEQMNEAKGKEVTLAQEASYRKGDCMVESNAEFVDCGVSGQIERLSDSFRKAAEEEDNGHDGNTAKIPGVSAET